MARGRPRAVRRVPAVSPAIPTEQVSKNVYADELDNGDAFIWQGGLWIRCDWGEQEAVLISPKSNDWTKGFIKTEMCEERGLIPVDITIKWAATK